MVSILGDQSGYFLGYRTGPRFSRAPDSLVFKQEYVTRTQAFYEKHGGKTLIYAKFVPIVRTFAPFMAGVGRMRYARFLSFNIFGGIGWVLSMTLAGYYLGGVPIVRRNFRKSGDWDRRGQRSADDHPLFQIAEDRFARGRGELVAGFSASASRVFLGSFSSTRSYERRKRRLSSDAVRASCDSSATQ